jgi:hypothetical protein
MQFNRFSRSLCLVLTIWLTACGGGGSGGGNTPPANQVAAGKWDDGNGSSILVAPNGEAWATDFNHFPDKFVMYHGHVVMNGSAFSFSGDLFDAGTGAHGASPVSMTGTLTTKGTLTATATTKYGTQTYSLPYRATYDTTPNQADLREDALGRGGLPVAARAMSFVSLSPARVFCVVIIVLCW